MKTKQPLKLLYLSFYNLNYCIGASASLLDQLNSLPKFAQATVIEPNRTDLPQVKIDIRDSIQRIIIPLPLRGLSSSLLYPLFTFFYALKIVSQLKPHFIFSMHHPHHYQAIIGHIISKILKIPNVVDVHDVLQPPNQNRSISTIAIDTFEQTIARIIKKDLLIFPCTEQKEILQSRINHKLQHTLILPNCIADSLLKNIKIKKHQHNNNIIKFVFVGRVGKLYNLPKIEPLFEALESIGYKPKLFVVGHRQESPPKFARFVGILPRKETLKFTAQCDVGVGPLNPIFTVPKKIVEYLLLEKIVIVSKDVISKDIQKKYRHQILEVSNEKSPIELAEKLLYKLKNKPPSSDNSFLLCSQRWKHILQKINKSN